MLPITMGKRLAASKLFALAMVFWFAALFASAHERDAYKIGDKYYLITVGSLNEPFVVDSMSGVDLRVAEVAAPSGGASKTGAKARR